MKSKAAGIAVIAVTLALAGGARAQLGLGLPPIGLPSSSPLPPPIRTSRPPVRAPKVAPPPVQAAPEIAVPPSSQAVPGVAPLPDLSTGEFAGALDVIRSDVAAGVSAAAVSGANGTTEIVLKAARAPAALAGEALDRAMSYAERARDVLGRHGDVLEADDRGRPVVRGEVMGLGVTPQGLAAAKAAGFQVRSQERLEGLDIAAVVLVPPRGMPATEAVRRLRSLDPAGRYDFNHLYFESGAAAQPPASAHPAGPAAGRGLRIGLVDGSASADQPALARTPMVQRAFAPGGARVTAHATAVASLLAGAGAGFRGAAPGATLYVADVYGPTPAGGSALSVARGLGWLAQARTPVINISLVGPPNALLGAAVAALAAKGHVVVAAVGNDGPGAGPLYPAAYPGVVAVTAVDTRRRVLPEAGRGGYVGFAAPGADMLAAGLDGGLSGVRGTSFAAPLVAGRLAQLLPTPEPAGAQRALAALSREAADLGSRGRDPVYGRGLVAYDLAVRPTGLARR